VRIDPLSEHSANTDRSEPTTVVRPYSLAADIGRLLRLPPSATVVLVLLTVGAFLVQVLGSDRDWQRAVGLIPANVADPSSLLRIADDQVLPAWLTLFSYMFLHSGVFHLLANMAGLWMFGILTEPVMGTKRFALTYLAFGVIGGMVIVAIIPHWTRPMVGASAAICGILGTFLAVRFSVMIGPRRQTVAGGLVEAIPLLVLVLWFLTRKVPSEPDRVSSAAWHLIPFLLAWYSVRSWIGLKRLTHHWRSGPTTTMPSAHRTDTCD
jgi:membrane associated rhomboid family serine protease